MKENEKTSLAGLGVEPEPESTDPDHLTQVGHRRIEQARAFSQLDQSGRAEVSIAEEKDNVKLARGHLDQSQRDNESLKVENARLAERNKTLEHSRLYSSVLLATLGAGLSYLLNWDKPNWQLAFLFIGLLAFSTIMEQVPRGWTIRRTVMWVWFRREIVAAKNRYLPPT